MTVTGWIQLLARVHGARLSGRAVPARARAGLVRPRSPSPPRHGGGRGARLKALRTLGALLQRAELRGVFMPLPQERALLRVRASWSGACTPRRPIRNLYAWGSDLYGIITAADLR